MAKILFRQKAIDDLNDIWNYTTERWSVGQADKYYASMKLAFSGISENPDIGKNTKEYKRIYSDLNLESTSFSISRHQKVKLKLSEFYMSEWI